MAKYDDESEAIDGEAHSLLEEIRARYQACRDHWREWRKEARELYRFYAGEQWTEEEKAHLAEQQRPCVTFNRAGVLIDAVLGHEANNRNEIRYIPRTQGDAAVNEILTNVSQFFLDECDGETHQSDAFRDMLITGIGWTRTRLDDEENPEYDLKVERVSPFRMWPDPSSTEPNFADSRYLFHEHIMDIEEVKSMFPAWDGVVAEAEWNYDDDESVHNTQTSRDRYTGQQDDKSVVKDVKVIEYQYKCIERFHLLEIPQDEGPPVQEQLDDEAYEERKDKIEQSGLPVAHKRKVSFKRCFVIGGEIVHEDEISPKSFTYHAITGKRDQDNGVWFGLMRSLKDPQEWSNKWLSQMMHIINTNATSGLNIEEDAVDNIAEAEARNAKPGRVLVFKPGSLAAGKVEQVEPSTFPQAVEKLLEYANQSFGDVSGVNAELLGMADREQPGVLEWQRKQSAVSLLAPVFDSLRRYRKLFGRTWLYFIQTYVSDGRVARITQDDGRQSYIPVTPEVFGSETAEYDVVIDQAASAPNQKEATWATLTTLFPAIKDMLDPQTLLLLLEYSPIPESLIAELKEMAKKRAEEGPPPDPEMIKVQGQMELEKQKAEVQAQLKEKELQLKIVELQAELEMERMKFQQELEIKQKEADMDLALKAQLATAEDERARQQMGMDRERADNDMKIKKEQFRLDFAKANANGKDEKGQPIDLRGVFGADETAKALTQMGQTMQESNAALAQAFKEVAAALSKPRTLLRGADGRATGIH